MSITLYTAPDCIRCKIVKAFLAERNIEYGTVDFKENAQEFNTFYRTNRKAIYRNPEGVEFHSHIDGRKFLMGPAESIRTQRIPVTHPRSSPRISTGLVSIWKSIPSSLAWCTSSRRAGSSASERR